MTCEWSTDGRHVVMDGRCINCKVTVADDVPAMRPIPAQHAWYFGANGEVNHLYSDSGACSETPNRTNRKG
jgi:hypothetical protein